MQTRPLFRPLMIDYRLFGPEDQAVYILDLVNDYHEKGYAKVGLTFSANHQQVLKIDHSYQQGHWRTWTEGSNQALVISLIEQHLARLQYSHLQNVFRILPITTCAESSGRGAVNEDWLDNDLVGIRLFLTGRGSVVLGWQNQLTFMKREAPYAIGGDTIRQLTLAQTAKIQKQLLALQKAYPSDDKGHDPSLSFATIKLGLDEMLTKAAELRGRGYEEAAVIAEQLVENLDDALTTYWDESRDPQSFVTFKRDCEEEIAKARPLLSSFRGWSEILTNLSLAIAGLGVIYLAAAMLNKAITGRFLFFAKTDSIKKLESIESSLSQMVP